MTLEGTASTIELRQVSLRAAHPRACGGTYSLRFGISQVRAPSSRLEGTRILAHAVEHLRQYLGAGRQTHDANVNRHQIETKVPELV